MFKTINDPSVKSIIDKCAEDLEKEIGLPVKVYYNTAINYKKREEIIEAVCNVCNVTWSMVQRADRHRNIVTARQIYSWVCTMIFNRGVVEVGKDLGQDHTSVIHHRERINDLISIGDLEVIDMINKVKAMLLPAA
jgi:chromosomal replication initiation ATPase DnaA